MVMIRRAVASPTNRNIEILVKILFIFVILLLLPTLVTAAGGFKESKKKRKRYDLQLRNLRVDCAKEVCKAMIAEESMNCVFICMSPSCYDKVFENPLEDGEINLVLGKEFDECVRQDFRELFQKRRVSPEMFA
jgi:hypothetical protein